MPNSQAPIDLADFDTNDAEICLRTASVIERRNPECKEDRLIIAALRFLATGILDKPTNRPPDQRKSASQADY